jgi:hypothetical protein
LPRSKTKKAHVYTAYQSEVLWDDTGWVKISFIAWHKRKADPLQELILIEVNWIRLMGFPVKTRLKVLEKELS